MSETGQPPPLTEPRRSRPALKITIAGVVVLALAAGGAYAAGIGPFADSEPAPEAVQQAEAFLADWSADRLPDAGKRTTSPSSAEEVLRNFTAGLDIEKPKLKAGEAKLADDGAVTVPYTAKMPVTGLGTWKYRAELPLRDQGDGVWKVDWKLSAVHPRLSDTAKFRLDRAEDTGPKITDRTGTALSADSHPSLGPVLNGLKGKSGAARGAVQLVDRGSGDVKRTEAKFGKQDKDSDKPIRTTLDATWQRAAEDALDKHVKGKDAALVALRVDNGEILAAANAPGGGFDRALTGSYAPGSTWKLVTSASLLRKQAVRPDDKVDCPKYLTVGKRFQNVELSEHPGATFSKDFTESCNTAFISLRDKLGDAEQGQVAKDYFGVGQRWHVGVPTFDGSVPAPRDQTEKAAAMIGQGRVLASPLVMASVTATSVSGSFQQPSLVPGTKDTTSTKKLPGQVVTQLRSLMRATVTGGTATMLKDLPGEVGAKTGTAEVSDDAPNNGWLVAHRGNVAIACIVEGGKTGGGSAGPVIHDTLQKTPAS